MVLLKYMKKSSLLPKSDGPLSERMPSLSIASTNKEVKSLLNSDKELCGSKRGQYFKYSDDERAKVAKRASEIGVTNALQFFRKEFSDRLLKESTVHTWKTNTSRKLN